LNWVESQFGLEAALAAISNGGEFRSQGQPTLKVEFNAASENLLSAARSIAFGEGFSLLWRSVLAPLV